MVSQGKTVPPSPCFFNIIRINCLTGLIFSSLYSKFNRDNNNYAPRCFHHQCIMLKDVSTVSPPAITLRKPCLSSRITKLERITHTHTHTFMLNSIDLLERTKIFIYLTWLSIVAPMQLSYLALCNFNVCNDPTHTQGVCFVRIISF